MSGWRTAIKAMTEERVQMFLLPVHQPSCTRCFSLLSCADVWPVAVAAAAPPSDCGTDCFSSNSIHLHYQLIRGATVTRKRGCKSGCRKCRRVPSSSSSSCRRRRRSRRRSREGVSILMTAGTGAADGVTKHDKKMKKNCRQKGQLVFRQRNMKRL